MISAAARRASRWFVKFVLLPFSVSAACAVTALLWTFPLQHLIAYPFVFLFFGAVMASAWFGGFIAGGWAILISAWMVDFFFIPPLYSMKINRDLDSFFGAFIVCAIAVTAISASRRRNEDLSRAMRDKLEHMVRERTAELEQSNEEIIERERQLRALTEAIPQQIWRASANGQVEYCNQDLLKFTGKPMNEIIGEAFFRTFHPSDSLVFQQGWRASRQSGAPFEMEARVMSAAGQHRWFLIRGIPQYTAAGELSHWYGVHIDIENLYRAEQSLRVAQEDSARWSRTLSLVEMAASIAHEIKQPLTALTAQAHACRRWLQAEPMNAEKAAHAAENLVSESARASSVIDRVRSLFSEKDLRRDSVDVNALIGEVVQLSRDEAERRSVSIGVELAAEPLPILVDAVQIRQLILNLVLNAIESTVETGRAGAVMIRSELIPGGRIKITVRDNGAGISESIVARIFDPFFTTKPHGTGIGLSICRTIVEAHEGRIWAEPLDPGTAFHVVLGSGE